MHRVRALNWNCIVRLAITHGKLQSFVLASSCCGIRQLSNIRKGCANVRYWNQCISAPMQIPRKTNDRFSFSVISALAHCPLSVLRSASVDHSFIVVVGRGGGEECHYSSRRTI